MPEYNRKVAAGRSTYQLVVKLILELATPQAFTASPGACWVPALDLWLMITP